jgi:hypothetical protein
MEETCDNCGKINNCGDKLSQLCKINGRLDLWHDISINIKLEKKFKKKLTYNNKE